jgi:hypothetical protein
LLTAHVGNFEAGHLIPSELLTKPLHLARAPEPDPAAQAYVDALLKATLGTNVVTHVFDDDFRIGLVLMAALRAGDVVAMTCDPPGALDIRVFYFVEKFPVDVRHNAKIHRLHLARDLAGTPGIELDKR